MALGGWAVMSSSCSPSATDPAETAAANRQSERDRGVGTVHVLAALPTGVLATALLVADGVQRWRAREVRMGATRAPSGDPAHGTGPAIGDSDRF